MSRITFGGLSSGLDTNLLINQLLELERQPIVKNEERIKALEQVKGVWRDINMRLRNLHGTVQELCRDENFLSKEVVSTNSSCVQAKADFNAANATYELQVGKLATSHTVAMGSAIQDLLGKSPAEALGLAGKFKLNDVVIEVESADSLTALMGKINSSEANVEASIVAGHLILKSGTSGFGGDLKMSYVPDDNVHDDVLNTLKIYNSGTGSFYNQTLAARDAELTINGISVVRSSNEVDDLVEGVTFYLYAEGEESTYLRVSTDTEKAMSAMGAFIEQYNSVNEFIREKLQKPEKDSTGSVGLLQGDTALMRIENTLRGLISSPVSGYRHDAEEGPQQRRFNSFSSIGITTIDKEGFLQLDAAKFAKALEEDPQAIYGLMNFELENEEGEPGGQFDGLGARLDSYLKRLLLTGQDSMGRTSYPIAVQQEEAVQKRIDELERRNKVREDRLLRYEERLIRQFTSLEKYISEMQSKGEDLARMIGQLPTQQNQN